MTLRAAQRPPHAEPSPNEFRHEAFLYVGEDGFLAGAVPFIFNGVEAGEATLVAVSEAKTRRLRAALGGASDRVRFVDIVEVGRNPARIIPVWRDFVDRHAVGGATVRGIGEPVWGGRSDPELVECRHHESMLNLAFEGGVPWRLMCPYDVEALDRRALEVARSTHPHLADEDGGARPSEAYLAPAEGPGPFDGPLAEPAGAVAERRFGEDELGGVRRFVYRHARDAGLDRERTSNLVLALNELAANSVRHAGGRGTVRVWSEPGEFVGEVRDTGRFQDPLVGRARPSPVQLYNRGLWLVNQVCDLVQIRSTAHDNVVRVRMSLERITPRGT